MKSAALALLRRPRAVGLAALAVAALAAFGLTRLRIDPDVEHLLPRDDPALALHRQVQGEGDARKLLFVILRGEGLAEALPGAVERLRASPLVAEVAATREELAPVALSEEAAGRVRERLTSDGVRAALESAKRRIAEDPIGGRETALADPLGLRWILAGGESPFAARIVADSPYVILEKPAVALLRLRGREEASKLPFAHALLADVRSRLPGLAVELAGGYVTAVTQEAALKRDMKVETVVSAVAVMLYVGWFTRSLLAAHLVFVPVILAIASALAVGGAVLGPLTPLLAGAAAILVAQGIDFPLHFYCRWRAERASKDLLGALHAAQVGLARPFAGIAVTLLAAFLALLASGFPGLRQFGFVLAVGVLFCFAFAMLLFPALLGPVDRRLGPAPAGVPLVVKGAVGVLRSRARGAAAAALVLLGVAAWGVVGARGIGMDLDLRRAMAPDDPGIAALERLEGELGTALMPVAALTEPGRPVAEGVERLRREGVISAAAAPAERRIEAGWVPRVLEELGRQGFKPEPFRKGLEATEARLAAAPAGLVTDPAGKAWRVTRLYPKRAPASDGEREAFDGAVRAALGEVLLLSSFHLPARFAEVMEADLLKVSGITAAAIVVLTLLAVGRPGAGLLALLPAAAAVGATLAVIALTRGTLNVVDMAALPIILAVSVDGGLHLMCRHAPGRRPEDTLLEVGPGVWGSAATTLLGFGSIAASVTPGMASLGAWVVVGTLTSALATLFLLPALLGCRKAAG